ncbi:histidine kinase dimerization/phosphoacceptor domain -containing protein [Roseovarius atlanticus]|uniref:histidine kinase dimerization/phosphoacceptor domain -containing protein n=1 Tax=Roseovarius atlanticus TaxID=1641875 RepID=UPI001C987883|nr:histidine kinase dimerization/phosphoacceptor domain -containing protein [Roseovarius atlanticus]MBY5989389.1 ATP-binding protein [Roseovarius atlanticus]MBY6124781.1 ATP-binding protein [Roseovarius atlanticus]MBY6149276.1 ATP-binding protein [Roseovarius atlanticus]
MAGRRVKIDLVDWLAPRIPAPTAQALVAGICAILAVLARGAVDTVFPGAGPFALTLPFVLFATLFGRWGAGVGVMCFTALYAWYFVLPIRQSFAFNDPTDGPRVFVNVFSGFLVVALAEYFRRVVRRALLERNAIAEERRLLLLELDHRVKNNFAMVNAMLRIEMRKASEAAMPALMAIHSRVDSIARAHEALYREEGRLGEVPMRPYLTTLCASLQSAYLQGQHRLTADIADISLPRDNAVEIGLLVNELCINAAKHAFPNRSDGKIHVSLAATEETLTVSVSDDGIGIPDQPAREGSQGHGLIHALAQKAGGALERVPVETGTKFEMVISRA